MGALSNLDVFDWSFGNMNGDVGIHSIHPYPAKFIPQIPRRLIEQYYKNDGSAIIDPFCGSGTTLVEAYQKGIPYVGIDLNPIACLLSKVKTTPVKESILPYAKGMVSESQAEYNFGKAEPPSIPNIDHWFKPDIQNAVTCLILSLCKVGDPDIKDALRIALSSILVRVSNQESDTRYAAIQKAYGGNDVFREFLASAKRIDVALATLNQETRPPGLILNKDTTLVEPSEIPMAGGLVITSPPYPNAYEYWLYHKYRMYWLGMDPIAVKNSEIGARAHYFKKNHQTEADFERQMTQVFSLLSKTIRRGDKACFLIGRSIIHGRFIDNTEILVRAASKSGFKEEAVFKRSIPSSKKSFNPAHGKITTEDIIVFNLGGS
jgi:site-specific DNA-methyltransferase (cytosine-N4-specific)